MMTIGTTSMVMMMMNLLLPYEQTDTADPTHNISKQGAIKKLFTQQKNNHILHDSTRESERMGININNSREIDDNQPFVSGCVM
jgi:hypothetical protein